MKISRLYIKNFILVMAIVVAAQLCTASVFRLMSSRERAGDFKSNIRAIAFLLADQCREPAGGDAARYYTELFQKLGRTWNVNIWLVEADGSPVASDSWIEMPELKTAVPSIKDAKLSDLPFDESGIFIPEERPPLRHLFIRSENGRIFYIESRNENRVSGDVMFLTALCIITVMVALILLPVSRRIADPLKKLTESADAVSRGEFSLRVPENSGGEVGDLARSFNIMTEHVVQMIDGTKKTAASISHQIRSPLARISVSLDILREKLSAGDRKKTEKIFTSIGEEIDSMVGLTEHIIELIRVETAHSFHETEEICLTDEITAAVSKFMSVAEKKNISLSSGFSRIPLTVRAVKRDISVLLDILFENSILYAPEGGTVKCLAEESDGTVSLHISNTSAPLAPEALAEIFEPFRRYAPEKIPGNGLGLAIAKGIMENHKGTISVRYAGGIFTADVFFKKNNFFH